ncbi:MAG: hypothetical protein AAF289_12235 [Cyanobacteria bacterium P01_A01_bin.135]
MSDSKPATSASDSSDATPDAAGPPAPQRAAAPRPDEIPPSEPSPTGGISGEPAERPKSE